MFYLRHQLCWLLVDPSVKSILFNKTLSEGGFGIAFYKLLSSDANILLESFPLVLCKLHLAYLMALAVSVVCI